MADSPHKNPLFSLNERKDMIDNEFSSSSSIEVVAFDNLLVEFAKSLNAQVIVRGLRVVSDFEYEFQMVGMNRQLNSEIDYSIPEIMHNQQSVLDPRIAYQITSMLEGVILRGTGRRIKELDTPLGGKTGTTNDNKDAWFVGFSPDLAVGVYVGFDQPKSLGYKQMVMLTQF